MTTVLTIAGSDPCGGAGIQVDLKVFHSLRVHGLSVITAVTVQNTLSVKEIFPVPPDIVQSQLEVLLKDINVQVVKTGMLYSREISLVVADTLSQYHKPLLVMDPVNISSSGKNLTGAGNIKEVVEPLLPLTTIITPNRREAEALTGININTREDMERAAAVLTEMGVRCIVITGGEEDATDLCYIDGRLLVLPGRQIPGRFHGTGCVFSAALSSYIARGGGIEDALIMAKEFTTKAIELAFSPGRGMKLLKV